MPDLPTYWSRDKKMAYNAVWVLEMMLQRKTLYDCGPRYWVGFTSPYYRLERGMTAAYHPKAGVYCPDQ